MNRTAQESTDTVNKALEAFVSQLPVAPPTPTPNNNTLENLRSGLANSGSGGIPSESRDGESGHELLSFLDAYSGYNQIKMDLIDEEKASLALKNLKTYLSNPPLLAKPKVGERLLIYLAVSEVAVSVVLVCEDQDAEMWYPQLEKLALALIMASRKLRPYFQCHLIAVVTVYPLVIYYTSMSCQPRNAIKSQVLADFVADFSQGMQLEAEKELQVFNGSNPGIWTLFTDGSSNVKGADLGIILVPPTGLELARELGINQIVIKSDSQLIVNQVLGTYTAREARM
ncbi:uncharacterized protein LOC142176288 [Nicotiana tabacum]|uniref:Uncharacterized protein LOC142176288 n=1 Tax=Nicotiana tabacum TaxID=4097 RepID=A0AC58TQL4_TOBAC